MAAEFGCEIVQTSAKYDENVEEMFHKLIALAHHLDEGNREQTNDFQILPDTDLNINDKGSHGDGARDDTKDNSGDTSGRIFETTSTTIINHTDLSRPTDDATERIDDSIPRSNYRERTGWRRRFSNFLRHL